MKKVGILVVCDDCDCYDGKCGCVCLKYPVTPGIMDDRQKYCSMCKHPFFLSSKNNQREK